MMRKQIRLLTIQELPELFKTYWMSPNKIDRPYTFYDVEGELYIQEESEWLLHHWTQDSCGGIACFRLGYGQWKNAKHAPIEENRTMPYVAVDGVYLFECVVTEEYETSLRHPVTGEFAVVHSG